MTHTLDPTPDDAATTADVLATLDELVELLGQTTVLLRAHRERLGKLTSHGEYPDVLYLAEQMAGIAGRWLHDVTDQVNPSWLRRRLEEISEHAAEVPE